MTGRSFRIYLVDGDASGLLTAEVIEVHPSGAKFLLPPEWYR